MKKRRRNARETGRKNERIKRVKARLTIERRNENETAAVRSIASI